MAVDKDSLDHGRLYSDTDLGFWCGSAYTPLLSNSSQSLLTAFETVPSVDGTPFTDEGLVLLKARHLCKTYRFSSNAVVEY